MGCWQAHILAGLVYNLRHLLQCSTSLSSTSSRRFMIPCSTSKVVLLLAKLNVHILPLCYKPNRKQGSNVQL